MTTQDIFGDIFIIYNNFKERKGRDIWNGESDWYTITKTVKLQRRGVQAEAIDIWQKVGKCKDEFVEIRNIWQK